MMLGDPSSADDRNPRAGRPAAGSGDASYDDGAIARVQAIVRKQGLGRHPEVQVHEDALCLVFLETQFEALATQIDDDDKSRDR